MATPPRPNPAPAPPTHPAPTPATPATHSAPQQATHQTPPQQKPAVASGIGAKPSDPKDPQAAKFETPKSIPPKWEETPKPAVEAEAWDEVKPSLDPRDVQQPPNPNYPDGMPIAVEQRARSAAIEQAGAGKYPPDERTEEEKSPKQVPGVTPPTKRE